MVVKLEKITDQYRRGKAVDASKLKLVADRLLAATDGSHQAGSLEALLQAHSAPLSLCACILILHVCN